MLKRFYKTLSFFALMGLVLVLPAKNALAISISARISDQYTEVIAGNRLSFEVEIKWPENTKRQDLRVEYQIIDPDSPNGENGEVIASEKVLRAVETQASFLDYIVVPASADSGKKILNVIITDYADMRKEVSATFNVLKGSNQIHNYFYILMGAMALVIILVVAQLIIINKRLSAIKR